MTNQVVVSRFHFFVLSCLACVLLSPASCIGQLTRLSTDSHERALVQFLQKEFADTKFGIDETTRYSSAIIESDGITREEIVVYISGRSWCGSGGCRLWVLEPEGESFKIIGEMTIVQLPIRVLHSKSHGHFDIGVWVQGGGIQPGYEALMQFDGKSYLSNPSVAPARHLTNQVAGKVLIARGVEGELLYK
jgi:hypothetical protein